MERDLFSLPLRMGGLGVVNPVSAASRYYDLSLNSTASLVKFITGVTNFELDAHIETVSLSKEHNRQRLAEIFPPCLIDCCHSLMLFNNVRSCGLRSQIFLGGCL